MATTVSIAQTSYEPSKMSTNRRLPLVSIPNAANSPHRTLGSHSATKRSRHQVSILQDNEPPAKKQMLEKEEAKDAPVTPRRRAPPSTAEGRVFERGNPNAVPTTFQKKLLASRGSTLRVTKAEKSQVDNAETVRQWQKHYRRLFPTFVFFFESIPEEQRAKLVKQISGLGAHEEKFFSRTVTHVVTTRPLPPDLDTSTSSETPTTASTTTAESQGDSQPRTINPSLLERSGPSTSSQSINRHPVESDNTLKVPPIQLRRDVSGPTDVLSRARQMGMKIWQLEKLQRMVQAIQEGDGANHSHNTRGSTTIQPKAKAEDLSQLLRNEKLNGPSDRDPTAMSKEIVAFRGPFLYVHDMDEKYKPTMMREYPKVGKRQDGQWPQFRSAPQGKCPFLDEATTNRDWQKEKEREKAMEIQKQKETRLQEQQPSQRQLVAPGDMEPPRRRSPRKALKEIGQATTPAAIANPLDKFKSPRRQPSMARPVQPPKDENRENIGPSKPSHMYFSREPAASGIQQSNLTSAIRSQMISSTAAAPGARAGTSKEVHELKRKVLEKTTGTGSLSVGSMSNGSIPSSHRVADLAGALKNARAPAPQRAAKSRAQEKLGGVPEEEDTLSETELAMERMAHGLQKPAKKAAKKEPKPGYCENCRDKFDDFDDHTISRKHRKFAQTQSNWSELDALLRILQRPQSTQVSSLEA